MDVGRCVYPCRYRKRSRLRCQVFRRMTFGELGHELRRLVAPAPLFHGLHIGSRRLSRRTIRSRPDEYAHLGRNAVLIFLTCARAGVCGGREKRGSQTR